jgi:hypothetical protein
MMSIATPRLRTALAIGIVTSCVLAAVPALAKRIRARRERIPLPGPKKQDPKEREKMLDIALEDSMAASDPPAITQPDVKL